jgi:hypothetical protein
LFFPFSHISTRYAIRYATSMGIFDDYERAREERDREFFEARQRQRRIWQEQDRVRQEELEQSRREDAEERAADAKADALARQQLWELFVKAVSKPTSVKTSQIVVPLAPDRERAQVDAQNAALNVVHVRNDVRIVRETSLTPKTTPENVVNAQNDARNVENDAQNVRFFTSESSSVAVKSNPNRPAQVPQEVDLAQVRILVLQTQVRLFQRTVQDRHCQVGHRQNSKPIAY